jgi:preprotein translocase subunit SecA
MRFLSYIFSGKRSRDIRKLRPIVNKIGSLESEVSRLSDAELRQKTDVFKKRLADGETLDDILPEAYAVVREAAVRRINQRPFDVQLMGGIVLHQGKIAEMKTGEGKTLVATFPLYLNALAGKGCHLVTPNDYLSRIGAGWMGPIYDLLGVKVAVIAHDFAGLYNPDYSDGRSPDDRLNHFRPIPRQEAYLADITYGTNNEFGFDYLRDNTAIIPEFRVQRGHYYAIVDEVDSILIDEARTPLIISGPAEESTELYMVIDRMARRFKPFVVDPNKTYTDEEKEVIQKDYDYQVDEKQHTVAITERGVAKAEKELGVENLYAPQHTDVVHHVNQSLRAHSLFHRDEDYVVKDGEVIIVDEFTGRLMPGRRYSEGLHQALEAKERVKVARENQTLATITLQNYFRMYDKLAGMTGTAETEAKEFWEIYKLDVVVIPTNMPMIRADLPDVIYKTEKEKFEAIIDEIEALHRQGRPVLVGTISIEKSERLSRMLEKRKIPHQVLNAKYHEKEAQIVARAGQLGNVTIATNMAGRGTDIILERFSREELLSHWKKTRVAPRDPSPDDPELEDKLQAYWEESGLLDELKSRGLIRTWRKDGKVHSGLKLCERVADLGGLHILGSERHEARRIDNQLRGRAGRQGDSGSSRFYLSLEDDLMRLFGSDRIRPFMEKFGMQEGEPIEDRLVSKTIEIAQKRVEARNFEIRKHLLEFDDVMNKQREVIYEQRRIVLEEDNLEEHFLDMVEDVLEGAIETYVGKGLKADEKDEARLQEWIAKTFVVDVPLTVLIETPDRELEEKLLEILTERYRQKKENIGPENMKYAQKMIMLQVVDKMWKDHLYSIDRLKEGINLRAYGQRDPLIEYKNESFQMFSEMIEHIKEEIVEHVFKVQLVEKGAAEAAPTPQAFGSGPSDGSGRNGRGRRSRSASKVAASVSNYKVGRNDPCPCGSGKKYKKCHGA